jgi:hypothetical protein
VAQIRSDLNNYYTLSNKNAIQILVTETGPPASGGIFPFLFAADDYLTWFENGASNVDYQDLHQGYLDPPAATGPPLRPLVRRQSQQHRGARRRQHGGGHFLQLAAQGARRQRTDGKPA